MNLTALRAFNCTLKPSPQASSTENYCSGLFFLENNA